MHHITKFIPERLRPAYSLAGDKPCPDCGGHGIHADSPGKYWDDDMRCWMQDYCDTCLGQGLVAIVCQHCEGSVDQVGYCRACDEITPVQPVLAHVASGDLPENGLAA